MKRQILLIFLLSINSMAYESTRSITDELLATVNKSKITFTPTKDQHASYFFVKDVKVNKSESSTPSLIISGTVAQANAGNPLERIPIYFALSKKEVPKLIGLTNVDGKFKFRLWVADDTKRVMWPKTDSNHTGYMYVGGSFQPVEQHIVNIGSYTQRLPMKKIIELYSTQQK